MLGRPSGKKDIQEGAGNDGRRPTTIRSGLILCWKKAPSGLGGDDFEKGKVISAGGEVKAVQFRVVWWKEGQNWARGGGRG